MAPTYLLSNWTKKALTGLFNTADEARHYEGPGVAVGDDYSITEIGDGRAAMGTEVERGTWPPRT